jgi:hypothetical protein
MPNSNFGLLNKLEITYTDKLETDGYKTNNERGAEKIIQEAK